jgi:hypothetical protein
VAILGVSGRYCAFRDRGYTASILLESARATLDKENSMPSVADYIIISDDKVPLAFPIPATQTFNFTPLPDYDIGSRVVLFFVVATHHNEPITFWVHINGQEVLRYTVVGAIFPQTLHEVIQAGLIKKGQNTIDFNVDTGRIDISDVLIMVGANV